MASVRAGQGISLRRLSLSDGPGQSNDPDHALVDLPLATWRSGGLRLYAANRDTQAWTLIPAPCVGWESGMVGRNNGALYVSALVIHNLERQPALKSSARLVADFGNEFVRRLNPGAVKESRRRGKIPIKDYVVLGRGLLDCLQLFDR